MDVALRVLFEMLDLLAEKTLGSESNRALNLATCSEEVWDLDEEELVDPFCPVFPIESNA